MALIQLNTDPSPREVRRFASIWLPAFLALVGSIVFALSGSLEWAAAIWVSAAGIGWLAWRSLVFARVVYLGWLYAAYPIGWTVSHCVMLVIFYLVITPIALLMRLIRRDALARRLEPSEPSYWRPIPDEDVNRYLRQS